MSYELSFEIENMVSNLETLIQPYWIKKENEPVFLYGTGTVSWFEYKPVILTYMESGVDREVSRIWFEIIAYSFSEDSRQKLFDTVKPFKNDGTLKINYHINPYYRDGYISILK